MTSKKIEPTDPMVDEAANILSLDAVSTSLHSHEAPQRRAYRNSARAVLTAALNHPDAAGLFADDDRPVQGLPTNPGAGIVANNGRPHITATIAGQTYHAREAVRLWTGKWYGAWRSEADEVGFVYADQITPGTWRTA